MRLAAVDIGNTRIKAYGLDDGEIKQEAQGLSSVAEAIGWCNGFEAERVSFVTTRHLSASELDAVKRAGWREFTAAGARGVKVAYLTPHTLGADRLAAALGAAALFPGRRLLVADVGTALTLDVVSDAGEFLGGNISAGVRMRLRALHEFTSRLPLVEVRPPGLPFGRDPYGRDTESALLCGALSGVAAEIVAMARLLARDGGEPPLVVVTGGDARVVENVLKDLAADELEVVLSPSLIAAGLYSYEKNRE